MEVLRRSSVFAAEIMDAFDRSPTDKELVAQAKALGREFVHARLLRAGLAWSVPARAAPTPGGRLAEVCAVLLRLGECGPWRTGPGLRLAAPLSPHGAVPGAPWPAPSTAGPGSQGQRCGWPGGAQNSRRAGQTHPGGCCPAPPHPVLTGAGSAHCHGPPTDLPRSACSAGLQTLRPSRIESSGKNNVLVA